MKRFKGLIVGVLVGLMISAGGVFAAKGVMTYLKDTASGAGQSVIFDFLGGWNGTNCAPYMVASNATPRAKTQGTYTLSGYEGVTFIGVMALNATGSPQMQYQYWSNSSNDWVTVTADTLNSTNYGPFDRFLPGTR